MKSKETKSSDEPVGIVIAGMPAAQSVPRFSAYEWAPAPDVEDKPKAAA